MREFAKKIREHLEERAWHALRPSDIAKSIMIEGAELLEIFQWDNQAPQDVKADEAKMAQIRKELADVMIYCFDLASVLDIDVEAALEEKLERVKEKYPVELFNKDTHGADPGTEPQYRQVKEKFRKEGRN